MNMSVRYIFMFIVVVLLQVLLLNNICFLGFINPYLYVYFILVLPSSLNKDLTLLLGFLLGLVIDIFCGTLGCHAFATTALAYLKPYFQKVFGPREIYESVVPSMSSYGMKMFLQYVAYLVFIHHFIFFLIEAFTVSNIGHTILYSFLCSIFTILLIFLVEKLSGKKTYRE